MEVKVTKDETEMGVKNTYVDDWMFVSNCDE